MQHAKSGDTRPVLKAAKLGELTQGTIFTCGRAERYPGKAVHGLVMTARCDIAQSKFPVLNYVPVVSLKDWLEADGLDLLLARIHAELDGKLRSELKQKQISPTILQSVSHDQIAEQFFDGPGLAKPDKKAGERFRTLVSRKLIIKALSSEPASKTLAWVRNEEPKLIRELIERLFRHDVAGYYFLERLCPGDTCTGHICLLREMTTIPRSLALDVAKGIQAPRLEDPAAIARASTLCFDVDDFAMPIAQVASPTIEHVLQSFSNLFGRIGLSDPLQEEIDGVISLLTNPL